MASTTEPKINQTIESYGLCDDLGEGTFGKVKLGLHMPTKEKVAIKILEKEKIQDDSDIERITREIQILKLIRHPNIIQLYEIIEDSTHLYLITEFASGGELFDHIVQNKRLKEREACRFFQQIISGIEYVHKLGIVHRDLKPENLLLDKSKNIKIVDFGLSNLYKTNELLKTACGSPCYAAPEMIAGKKYVGLRVDIWSAGVILYAMICGYLPFDDPDTQLLYRKIMNGDYTIPNHVTPEGRDLIKRILNTDPERRYTIDQIRSHPWYKLYVPNEPQGILVSTHRIPVDEVILDQVPDYSFDKEEVRKHVMNNKHNKMTTLYYLLMLKASRNGYISPADVTNPNFVPELVSKDEGTKRDLSQDRPRSRSESAAKKDVGTRNPGTDIDARMTDRRESSNTPSRMTEKRPSIKPEARRPTNPQVSTTGTSATGAGLNNSMFNAPNPVLAKPTTDYSTKTQVVHSRTTVADPKTKRTNVQRMNTSGMDDSTQMVNRSANVSHSPVPKRPENGDNSQLDASGYKNKAEEDSINKRILRNKLKEVEEAGNPSRDKKPSVEPAASESRNYAGRGTNTSYMNTSGYGANNTSALRETTKNGDRSQNTSMQVGTTQAHTVEEERTRRAPSEQRRSVDKKDENKENASAGLKIHKGPLNLATVSLKPPVDIMKNFLLVIEELGFKVTIVSKFSAKCEKGGIKFTSEINMIENMENLYTMKFYKSSGDSLKYATLCNSIFQKMSL